MMCRFRSLRLAPFRNLSTAAVIGLASASFGCGPVPETAEINAVDRALLAPTPDRVTFWDEGYINTCVTGATSDADFAAARANLEQAAQAWQNVANIRFDFRCWPSTIVPATYTISLRRAPNLYAVGGTSGVGQSVSVGADITYCAPSTPGSNCTELQGRQMDGWAHFRATAIHELGHGLGFVHEHKRIDTPDRLSTDSNGDGNIDCLAATAAERAGNEVNNGFEPGGGNTLGMNYDPASIMNYCRDTNGDGQVDHPATPGLDRLSAGDIAGARRAYGPAKKAVLAFSATGFGGTSANLVDGLYEASRGELPTLGDNAIRSMQVSAQNVVVCSNDSRSVDLGFCRLFGPGNYASLGVELDGKVSLIAPMPDETFVDGRIRVFEHSNFIGNSQFFGNGVHQAIRGHFKPGMNDAISSIEIVPGTRAIVCTEDAAAGVNVGSLGACRIFSRTQSSLDATMNDGISLAAVWRTWGASLSNANGTTQSFHVGTHEAWKGELDLVGNDSATTLEVPLDSRVMLCDNDGASGAGSSLGECRYFGPGRFRLPSALRGRVSLIHVSPWSSTMGTQAIAVAVASDINFEGDVVYANPGMREAVRGELGAVGNDRSSSLVVLNGFRTVLCDGDSQNRSSVVVSPCQYYPAGQHTRIGALNDLVSMVTSSR